MIYASTKKLIGIGGMRCGSTSLHRYLCQHPYIHGAEIGDGKEMHFFDQQSCSLKEYVEEAWPGDYRKDDVITENTPEYLPFEFTPERMMTPDNPLMWNAKFVVLIRNPIDRAYSHWKKRVATGEERFDFAKALAVEGNRTAVGLDQIKAGRGSIYSHMPFTYGYKYQSNYVQHLGNWFKHIDRSRIWIIKSEEFYFNPKATLDEVCWFMNLDPMDNWDVSEPHNVSDDPSEVYDSVQVYDELRAHFKPQVEDLQRLLHAPHTLWPSISRSLTLNMGESTVEELEQGGPGPDGKTTKE